MTRVSHFVLSLGCYQRFARRTRLVQPKEKEPPRCHQLPFVIRVSTKETSCSSATPEKKRQDSEDHKWTTERCLAQEEPQRQIAGQQPSWPAFVCTRGHDPDAEHNCFSSTFLLGMSWCSKCDDTLLSLCGGVQKIVIPRTPASQSDPGINRNVCSPTTAEQRQVAEKHRWTHRRYLAPQRCIDRVPPVSMPCRAIHKNSWASITQT